LKTKAVSASEAAVDGHQTEKKVPNLLNLPGNSRPNAGYCLSHPKCPGNKNQFQLIIEKILLFTCCQSPPGEAF
jgi:hypothetical protein